MITEEYLKRWVLLLLSHFMKRSNWVYKNLERDHFNSIHLQSCQTEASAAVCKSD